MANDLFVLGLTLGLVVLLRWGFRRLPHEEWQIMASIPTRKLAEAGWQGLNLTYYGFLFASATTLGTATVLLLLAAVGVTLAGAAIATCAILGLALPAAKIVARVVERKPATFTVGGAAFFALLLAPAILTVVNTVGRAWQVVVPIVPALAAVAIGYALGEGAGRLACISFGCCYGRPLNGSARLWRAAFATLHFTFIGTSKKVAYEGGLERQPVIPVQAITAVIDVGAGLAALRLFLSGRFAAGFLVAALVTQVWRALSETLRADHRGSHGISVYQVMAATGAVYALALAWLVPAPPPLRPDVMEGLRVLWNPSVILLLQALWLGVFLYTGRSIVTASTIRIYVVKERI